MNALEDASMRFFDAWEDASRRSRGHNVEYKDIYDRLQVELLYQNSRQENAIQAVALPNVPAVNGFESFEDNDDGNVQKKIRIHRSGSVTMMFPLDNGEGKSTGLEVATGRREEEEVVVVGDETEQHMLSPLMTKLYRENNEFEI